MDIFIVGLIVGMALAYVAWRAWNLVKRGTAGGCSSCGTTKSSCSTCPLIRKETGGHDSTKSRVL
jgi:hypothetical protein